jgi:hypothetical protein
VFIHLFLESPIQKLMSAPLLFGVIPAGRPLITEATASPSATEFLYAIPAGSADGSEGKTFSHLVVLLLPGVALPPDSAAAIYLGTMAAGGNVAGGMPDFRFLGGVGPGKESAVFKVGGASAGSQQKPQTFVVGISLEPARTVAARMADLASGNSAGTVAVNRPSTLVLAQRIIQNAFNFLASFSGTTGPNQVEVVPLKAFEEWWRKFESRVRSDPTFLEREADG